MPINNINEKSVKEQADELYRKMASEQKKKSRIYISGPITGTDDFISRFDQKEKELQEKGYVVLNPAHANSYMPDDATHEEYMRLSFLLLDMCSTIYMMDGWENSMGANQEYGYALAKQKRIYFE